MLRGSRGRTAYDRIGVGYRQVRRPDRRVAVLTFDPAPLPDLWLVRDYFPRAGEIHSEAMLPIERLAALLGPSATIEAVPIPRRCEDGFFYALWDRPEMHLDPEVRRASSVWHYVRAVTCSGWKPMMARSRLG